jgi:O-antigen ligase
VTIPVAWAARARPQHRTTAADVAAFAAGVLIVLIFSQGWYTAVAGDEGTRLNLVVRAMFFPAYLAGLFLLMGCLGDAARASLKTPILILLLAWVAASTLWSIDPGETMRRSVALFFTDLCGLVLAVRFRWGVLAEVFATAFAILATACFLAGLLVPSFGVMHELFPGAWRGLWDEKNALGGNMAIGFMMLSGAAILAPQRAKLWWPFAGLALLLVLLSTSKTSLVACMLGVCGLVLVALVRRGPAVRIFASYGAVSAAVFLAMGLLVASDVFLAALGKDATLTGRTQIWAAVMRQIPNHPWLGHGYAAIWSNESPWAPLAWITKQAGFRAHHAHNSWLEQWLGIGLIGLSIWAVYFLTIWVRAIIALYRSPSAYLVLPFLLVYTMTSLTESIVMVYNDMRWVILTALAVKLAIPEPLPKRPQIAPMRRQPSETVSTSAPPSSARSRSRARASGVQPQGDGVWPTSWV